MNTSDSGNASDSSITRDSSSTRRTVIRFLRASATLIIAMTGLAAPLFGQAPAASSNSRASSNNVEPFPRTPPLEPDAAAKTIRALHGFRMDLLAAEPLVMDPVAMEYDENGRAFVVEMSDYPYTDKSTDKPFVERTGDAPLGRVRVLEDRDGDGKFDVSTLLADQLSWPTGLALWKGGVFVAATPDIWYLKDTDGDGRADVRRQVFSGFRKFNVQAVMNNLKWGPDQQIYGAGSSNGGTIAHGDRPDDKPVTLGRNDFRFSPHDERLHLVSGGARFGNSFDDWGNRFLCNIRNPVQHVVLPTEYLARNPRLPVRTAVHDSAESGDTLPVFRISPVERWRLVRAQRWAAESGQAYPRSETNAEGYFTSSSGVTVYRGAAYPPEFHGNVFLGEVAANAVHRQRLIADGPTFRAERADPGAEFIASTDNWFRPVNFVNAPDGTLHVLDMYRETIEHPWSIPDDIKAQLDLESGRDRGRIYRLTPPNFAATPRPQLGAATTAELVSQLENANSWWRETSHRLLYERQDRAAVAPMRTLLRNSRVDVARLHALWSLAGLDSLSHDDLLSALSDPAAGVREHAVRLAERRLRVADSPAPTGVAPTAQPAPSASPPTTPSAPTLPSAPSVAATKAEQDALRSAILAKADDSAIRVRFQVAFTLGELPVAAKASVSAPTDRSPKDSEPLNSDDEITRALERIARRDAHDPWIRTAVLSSSRDRAARLLAALWRDEQFSLTPATLPLLRETAIVVGADLDPAGTKLVLTALVDSPRCRLAPEVSVAQARSETLIGLGESLPRANRTLAAATVDVPAAAALVDELLASATNTATDGAGPESARVQTVELLAFGALDAVRQPLLGLLDARHPIAVQQAAVRTLAKFTDAEIAPWLVDAYRGLTPPARTEVVEALLARSTRHPVLLDALEQRVVSIAQISATRRNLLLNHADLSLRERAKKLFAADAPGPRAAALARYRESLKLPSDPQRGEKVYARDCATCHRLGGRGHEVGPSLESVRHRSAEELLANILDPNREVAPNYLEYVVTLADGRVLTGIVMQETASSLTLRRAEGVQQVILRTEIEAIASAGKSLMPEGLEQKITLQEMADLLSWLGRR